MCKEANHKGPLYKCDFDSNLKAGKILKQGLMIGSSQHWRDAMEKITGTRHYDAQDRICNILVLII